MTLEEIRELANRAEQCPAPTPEQVALLKALRGDRA